MTYRTTFRSPIGQLILIADEKHLMEVIHESHFKEPIYKDKVAAAKAKKHPVLEETKKQLREYFKGRRKKFNIPLKLEGTEFQKQAWQQLRKIPYGKTISYQDQAVKLGDPKKCRAVGSANGRNPISIIVPCHRVVPKGGGLGGFGLGLPAKEFLLDLEQSH